MLAKLYGECGLTVKHVSGEFTLSLRVAVSLGAAEHEEFSHHVPKTSTPLPAYGL